MHSPTTTQSLTMRAVTHQAYGEADVLSLRDVGRPEPGPGEILIRVHAAGVDRGVWHLMTGHPYPIRLAGYGLRAPKHAVPGGDVAGTVEAVSANVTGFRPGDEVFGIGKGSFAEYVVAPADKVAVKPAQLTFEQAAAIPVSGLTALQAVRDHAQVQPGQQVLVIGASGGVGTYAVQLAKTYGATVTGVCSTAKVDLVHSIGADHVLDYSHQDFADGTRYDRILDIAGNASLSRLRRALTPTGRLTIVGGETGGRWLGGHDRVLRAPLMSLFVSQDLGGPWVCSENREDLTVLAEHIQADGLVPIVDRVFPLAQAADAIRYLVNGQARGKVVLTP